MKKKFVFHLGHSAGFYSEFNNMVLAILFCQYHGIEFQLYSADANFGVSEGWNDFFIPFCHETRSSIHHHINNRFTKPTGRKNRMLLAFYKMFHPKTYLTYELWDRIRHMDDEHPLEEIRQRCSSIIAEIYRFNDKTKREVEALEAKVDMGGEYLGMQIRRGDKIMEHEDVSLLEYLSAAAEPCSCERIFVMTDDYRMVLAVKSVLPESVVCSLTAPEEMGYDHNAFMKRSKEEKAKQLKSLFAQMEIMNKADVAVCTYSSNPGMFMGMRHVGKTIGVDYKDWLIW